MSGKRTRLSAITIAHTYKVSKWCDGYYYVGKSGGGIVARCLYETDAERIAVALSVYDRLVLTHNSITYADGKTDAEPKMEGYSSYIEERGDGNWLHQTYPSEKFAGGHYDTVWRQGRWTTDQFFSTPGDGNRLIQYAVDRCRVPYRVGNVLYIPVLGEA